MDCLSCRGVFLSLSRRPPSSTRCPYTTLFRSCSWPPIATFTSCGSPPRRTATARSEEHTSELQSHSDLVCRLLLEKKKKEDINTSAPHRPTPTHGAYILLHPTPYRQLTPSSDA